MRIVVFVASLMLAGAVAAADAPQEISWDDLMPEGEWERVEEMQREQIWSMFGTGGVAEGSPLDTPMQFGTFNVVEELDGKAVRLPGYILPFEYAPEGALKEFLLVPYFGACVHVPPPPPNQIVYVRAEDGVEIGGIWDAVWAEGVLSAERNMNGLGNAAYTLTLTKIEKYQF